MQSLSYLIVGLFLFMFSATLGFAAREQKGELRTAILGGGCFWCMEPPFEQLEGVVDVTAGYAGGTEENPTYEQVSRGLTGHLETVKVVYDPALISFKELLDTYWRYIDPTDPGGQFADRGHHYKTAIFYTTEEERQIAEQSKAELAASGVFDKPIATAILPATPFYRAEEYHQDYYKKNVFHYESYKVGSGRAGFLERTWKDRPLEKADKTVKDGNAAGQAENTGNNPAQAYQKPSQAELREKLSALQFAVTQEEDTEPPFKNEFWDNKKAGIYVDVVSGEPLFSSLDKYDSGTGWPSFNRPLEKEQIVEKKDISLFSVRTEVRSADADSHLGHVFDDGPAPTGMRYCINSAALRFVPVDKLEEEGYGEYLPLFK